MKFPLLFIGMIFGILILGIATLQSHIVILAIPLMVYLFAAILQLPEDLKLRVSREILPEFAPQGTPMTVQLTVTNQGGAIDELTVQDILPQGITFISGETSWVGSLEAQGTLALFYTIEARRGAYNTYELLVSARDYQGLFELTRLYRTQARLCVHPRYPKLARIKLRPPQTRGFAGPIAARQAGTGIDFWAVREYQSGDPQRQINWKLAARSFQELYTNVFEQERVADVGLILDARQRVNVVTASGSLFEHAVQAAAALAANFLDDGNRVSLLMYGAGMERVYPGYGRLQRERLLRAFSGASVGVNYALESLDYLPTRLFPVQSQLVIVSPLAIEDMPTIVRMRAHGYAVMVVSPDPIAYEAASYGDYTTLAYRLASAERACMLRRIRRCGVQVMNWRVDQPLDGLVRNRPALHVHRRGA